MAPREAAEELLEEPLERLVNIAGSVIDAEKFVPGTWRTALQITQERKEDPTLYEMWFHTNDVAIYHGNMIYFNKAEVISLREATSALDTITDSYSGERAHYPVELELLDSIIAMRNTIAVDTSNVRGNFNNGYSGSALEFSTSGRGSESGTRYFLELNPDERRLVGVPFGQEDEVFAASMKMLRRAGIKKTRVKFLAKNYLDENAPDALARFCWLYDSRRAFSQFDADVTQVDYRLALRGELKPGECGLAVYHDTYKGPEVVTSLLKPGITTLAPSERSP